MRYGVYGRQDTIGELNGDSRWMGIDSTRDRDKLAPGMLYDGQNTRLRTGTVRQRRGTVMPADFNPVGGFTNFLVGSEVFRNPNGDEVLLIAPANATKVYAVAFQKDAVIIDYSATTNAPTGDNGAGLVEFVQSFDQVMMFRIPIQGSQNLVWNGMTPDSDANRWQYTVLSTDGLVLVPPEYVGTPWGDRIIVYKPLSGNPPDRDTWLVTDLYDFTSYDDAYQTIRTNAADSDIITSIKPWLRGSAVIYKNRSIHMATDNGTFPFSVNQRKLSDLGAIGVQMPLEVGGDQFFLSQPNGFYRLSEVIQDSIIALPTPISEPIQRVIDQINWPFTAIWGCSAALDNYAFFAVCIGPAQQRLNCILVYNTQSRQWESAGDTWRDPTFGFNRLHVLDFGGTRRLCAVDYQNALVYLLYEGVRDELSSGTFSVPFKMETRAYSSSSDPLQFQRFGRARVSIASWEPSLNVTAITDGVNEEFLLTPNPITKDNTIFYTHAHAPFDPTTDDPRAPYREDYSESDFDDFVAETFEELPEGQIDFIPGTLFETIGDLQEVTEALMVRQIGRWGSLRVENDDGYVEVKGLTMESIPGVNAIKTAA